MALFMAGQEAGFLQQLQAQMVGKVAPTRDVVLYIDRQPAIDLVHNPVYGSRYALSEC